MDWNALEFKVKPCVRSGLCCKTATCGTGREAGADPKGCKFLNGDKPGFYSCGLAESNPEIAKGLYVGEGCCMGLFNQYRAEAVRNNPSLLDLFGEDGFQKQKTE